MAVSYLKNVGIWADSRNITGITNDISLTQSLNEIDTTTFASNGAKEREAELEDAMLSLQGFYEAGTGSYVSELVYGMGATPTAVPFTVSSVATAGNVAYGAPCLVLSSNRTAQVNDKQRISVEASAVAPMALGVLLHDDVTARTATGTGSTYLVGAASSTASLYVALHVISVSGTASPTLTVTVQRDDNSGMTTPTTAYAFTGATAIGSQYATVNGPITDSYYRVSYTISGTNPNFKFVAFAGLRTKP